MDLAIVGIAAVGIIALAVKKKAGQAVSGGETLPGGGGRPWQAEPTEEIKLIIESVAFAYGIPKAFAFADAAHESRFKPWVGLDTREGGAPEGAIPERSIGLFGININPDKPTGRARIAKIKQMRGVNTDAAVVDALRDPAFNAGFWASEIALPLISRAVNAGYTGRRKWLRVRLWLYGGNINLDGSNKWAVITRRDFSKTLSKWEERYGVA